MTRNGHKFNAVRTTLDGITFDSKLEAKRYAELKLLAKAGEIRDLELQPLFSLMVPECGSGFDVRVGDYIADFRYVTSHGAKVVEDVKGMKTPLYRWKKKHVEAQYGIVITEVTR